MKRIDGVLLRIAGFLWFYGLRGTIKMVLWAQLLSFHRVGMKICRSLAHFSNGLHF